MRAPPPIHIDLHGSAAERVLFAVLHGLAGAALAAWAASWWRGPADAVALILAALAGAAAGATIGLATHEPARGRLAWNGRVWQFGPPAADAAEACAGRLRVLIDAGPWLALRFEPGVLARPGRARWLLVGRRDAPGAAEWAALRAAVYCAANPPEADRSAASDRPA